jgi:undecaprenyl-diphosphatase
MPRRPSLLDHLHELDQRAFDAIASWHSHPSIDATLPRLSRVANHGVVWIAISALSWAFGRQRHKRAAVRGLLSLGIASFLANGPFKFAARRARPEFGRVPSIRALVHPPTTSFPSGHSASAAAFAVGYALEAPAVALPIGALATGVAVSRAYTGVHFPGDVLAGAALGAAAALMTKRAWPVVEDAALAEQRRAVLPRAQRLDASEGTGVTFVVNPSSGRAALGEISADDVRRAFPHADVRVLGDGANPADTLRPGSRDAHVLGACGGDGTVIAGAQVAMEADRPLAVAPGGTFNYFAHSINVETLDDTAAAVEAGEFVSVDVGTLDDDHVFLNMASIGAHVAFVQEREALEPTMGKPLAMPVALAKVIARNQPVHLRVDGRPLSAWMVFIGNCTYESAGFAPTTRERLDDGLLVVRIVRSDRRFVWLRILLGTELGMSAGARGGVVERRRVRSIVIESADGSPLDVSTDGEAFEAGRRVVFGKRPSALRVVVPPSREARAT